MEKFEIEKLRSLPIEGVAERLGLTVQRHKTRCPFHDDSNPSLSFHLRTNTYKCFVCDAHGSTIDLAMGVLGKDFKETCQWLASEYHVIITGSYHCHPESPYCHPEQPQCHPELVSGSENAQQQMLKQVQHDRGEQHDNPEYIAQRYSKYFERPFLNQAARAFLFTERRLHPSVIRWCKLTSWTDRNGTSWLQIPYFDSNGQLIGVQNRRLSHCHPEHPTRHPEQPHCHPELVSGSENAQQQMLKQVQHDKGQDQHDGEREHDIQPRFRFPKGSRCKIYNLPVLNLLKEGEELWIAEGCSDCWALLSSGKKAVAIPSATLLNVKDIEVLKGLNLHMYPDSDIPGEKLFLQLKTYCPGIVRHSLPESFKDFSEWYMSSRTK